MGMVFFILKVIEHFGNFYNRNLELAVFGIVFLAAGNTKKRS